ncbi:MAG: hypothetical protein PVH25_11215 [Burkholderiales bacterium]|jgi:hypothetical protein
MPKQLLEESTQLLLKVLPTPFARWRIEISGNGDGPGQPYQFVTKGLAITFAIAWADLHQPCRIEIYGFAGRVERKIRIPGCTRYRGHGSDRRRMNIPFSFQDRRRRERRIPL